MAKTLKTAALVIGAVVAVAAAIPTGGGSTLLAGALGVSAGTATAIAGGVSVLTSTITALPGKSQHCAATGSPLTFNRHQECLS